mgnify:CR=1 FL=1
MRRKITVFLIIAVCYLLQSTVFQALSFASISPNLMIVVVSAFGFMRGKKKDCGLAFSQGLLLDVFTGSILGFYALLYMYVGYFNGFFRENVFTPERLYKLADASDRSQRFFMQSDHLFPVILFRGKFVYFILSVKYHDTGTCIYNGCDHFLIFYNFKN